MENEFKIILLVGLPGSGKTYLGELLEEEDENTAYLDDMSLMSDPLQQLKFALGIRRIILSDVFLCRKEDRENAIKIIKEICKEDGFDYKLEWIFFENNPEKCLKNVDYRNKNGDSRLVKDFINLLTKTYEIPKGVVPRIIWNSDENSKSQTN